MNILTLLTAKLFPCATEKILLSHLSLPQRDHFNHQERRGEYQDGEQKAAGGKSAKSAARMKERLDDLSNRQKRLQEEEISLIKHEDKVTLYVD